MTVIYEGLDCVADMGSDEYNALMEISQSGKHAWAYQANYALYVLYFGAVLTFFAVVKHTWYRFDDWSYRNGHSRLVPMKKMLALGRIVGYKRFSVLIGKITGLPASFGTLIVLAACTLFILCVTFIPRFYIRACEGFGSPPLAVRAGMQVMALTPYLVIISGKTNFISFITGISYEKLNVFHQFLGWACFFLSWVHTVPFLIQPVREGGMSRLRYQWQTNSLYVNGVPPLVFLSVLCLLSTRFSRKLCYEIWFHTHWIVALAYIGTLTWHVYGALGAEKYIWGTIGFWGFQMLYRAVVKSTFKPNKYAFKRKRAALRRIANGRIEVAVDTDSKYELDWMPGQHVFIRFVMGMHTLDNHPFSMVTIPQRTGKSQLKLFVKPHRGLTSKLYNMVEEKSAGLDCYIDGPYGGMSRDPLSFDKLILMATGTGVTVTFPFIQYVAQNVDKFSCRVTSLEFNWVVTSQDSIEWIQDDLDKIKDKLEGILEVNIFVTNSDEGIVPTVVTSRQVDSIASSTSLNETKRDDKSPLVHIYYQSKPNVVAYLSQAQLLNKTAVICSGTSSFQGDCGQACSLLQRKVMKAGVEEIYLHTENFGW